MDIRMTYDNISQAGDFVVTKGDLATDRDLETAVLISLFTDRRASDDDVVPDGTDDCPGLLDGCSVGNSARLKDLAFE